MRLFAVFISGILLRLVLALVIPIANDIDAWTHYSTYWQQGIFSPYDQVDRYKYSPFWFWIISFVSWVCRKTGCPFAFGIRLSIISADVILFGLLLKSCNQLRLDRRRTLAVLAAFFLNPVSVQISGYYGQFDNMSLLFILLAWYTWTFAKNNFSWTLISLNLSLLIKHFTVMLVPVFAFAQKEKLRKIAMGLQAPLLFFMVLLPCWLKEPHWVKVNVFQYTLTSGYWGWLGMICRSVLLFTGFDMINQPWFRYADLINPLLYLFILIASFWIVKRYSLMDSIVLVLLLFYSLTTQIAPQYTLWIIPFTVFRPNRYFWTYSIVGGVQLAFFYYSHYHWFYKLPLNHLFSETFVIFRYLTWIACVFWLIHMLRKKDMNHE